jgi:hypothetical protein
MGAAVITKLADETVFPARSDGNHPHAGGHLRARIFAIACGYEDADGVQGCLRATAAQLEDLWHRKARWWQLQERTLSRPPAGLNLLRLPPWA